MVSVIIPMYQAENTIEFCLKSIIGQNYDDIEIVVVNDGSTDDSEHIVKELQKSDNRITIISQTNHGLVYSRKQGIINANGEYVLFVDSDDWIENNMISELLSIAISNKADIVASAVNIWMDNKYFKVRNPISSGIYHGNNLRILKKRLFCYREYSTMALLPFLWNKLWKRDLILDYILNADEDITVGEDVAIGFPAILSSKCVAVTDNSFYNYIKSPFSMTGLKKTSGKELNNSLRLYNYLNDMCKKGSYNSLHYMSKDLDRYLINQLFTRSYSIIRNIYIDKYLYPYLENIPNEVVLYGAGEFGKELYSILSKEVNVKYWIDRNADIFANVGLNIKKLEQCISSPDDIVIVAVLDVEVVSHIVKDLVKSGYNINNIKTFYVSDNDVKQIISYAIEYDNTM